jgi:hypothetical protein
MSRPQPWVPLVLASALVAIPATAGVAPNGNTFPVGNRAPVAQVNPTAAFAASGEAVVVWEHAKLGIVGQWLDASGKPDGRPAVLVANLGLPRLPGEGDVVTRKEPAAVFLANGDLLVAWTEEKAHLRSAPFIEVREVKDRDVLYQLFDRNLVAKGERRPAHGTSPLFEQRPVLVAQEAGAVIGYRASSTGSDRDLAGALAAQLLAADGAWRLPQAITIADQAAANLALAVAADGTIAAGFEACCDANDLGAYLRLYTAAGAAKGAAVQVNTTTFGRQRRPVPVANPGGWLVAFQGALAADTRAFSIYGRQFDANGAANGSEIQLSSGDTYTQLAPRLTALPSGHYFLLWMAWKDDNYYNVRGVELDAAGARIGDEAWLSQGTVRRDSHAALAAAGNRLLVVWPRTPPPHSSAIAARFLTAE